MQNNSMCLHKSCTVLLLCVSLLCSSLLTACASKKTGTEDSADATAQSGTLSTTPQSEQDSQHQYVINSAADNSDSLGHDIRMQTALPSSQETVYPHRSAQTEESLDDYDIKTVSISDPLEPWNRFWFRFNDIFFLYVARPLYTGYEFATPQEFRTGLKNFLANMLFPIRFINSFLQGKPMEAGVEFGRFMINTTVGLGGLIDVAKGVKAVVPVDPSGEDFGQTLGMWGMGQGFYLVWPIIGPSSARDTVGLGGDYFLDPTFYMRPWIAAFAVSGTLRFNSMGDILTLYEDMNLSAVDPYVAMREAYSSYRQMRLTQ